MAVRARGPRIAFHLISALAVASLATVGYLIFVSEAVAGPSQGERSAYQSELEQQIQARKNQLVRPQIQAEVRSEADLSDKLADLAARIATLEEKLNRFLIAGGQLWLEIRAELQEMRLDLDQAFARFRARFDWGA